MPADKRLFVASLIVFALSVALVLASVISRQNTVSSAPEPNRSPLQSTIEPAVVANLTRIPQQPALTGELANQVKQIEQMVDSCADYRSERRQQMKQHITWLLNPSQLSSDMIIALGANPTGRLLFGMATYTSSEWRLLNRPQGSCLLAIGRRLNEMLVANGETPFEEFDTP